jgi:hypothetical protein
LSRAGEPRIADEARDPEVDDLHAFGRQIDVGRLEIAVHDPRRVGVRQRGRDVARDLECAPQSNVPRPEGLLEASSFEPLHRHELRALVGDAVPGVAHDVRVAQTSERADLAREANRVGVLLHELDCDETARRAVAPLKDGSHPAFAHLREQLVEGGRRGVGEPHGRPRALVHRSLLRWMP